MYQTSRFQVAAGRLLAALFALTLWLILLISPGPTEGVADPYPAAPHTVDTGLTSRARTDRLLPAGAATSAAPLGLTAPPSTASSSTLSALEQELLRLTNELRADPSGPLRRQGPPPSCLDDPYFRMEVDPLTGHPVPVPALTLDLDISVSVSREWALQMYLDDSFEHRPSSAQQELYAEHDIDALAWGENIAWASGYSAEEVAQIHFEGWRESDIGHYCSLLTARFTRVGIGEGRVDGDSWAVQNFYRPATRPIPVP